MKQQVENLIKEVLKSLNIEDVGFSVEHPDDFKNGDYSTNIAMVCAKKIGKNPKELAETIKIELDKNLPKEISKIEIAGPGFINFYLSREFFTKSIYEILNKKEDWGKSNMHLGKKILVEHSSPNLFKPFHIGHLMNNTIGQSVVELAKFSGANVTTMTFPSDISLGVAKAIFILLEKIKHEPLDVDSEIVEYGNAYVEGVKRYDEDESIHDRVKEIADNLYAKKPSNEWDMFAKCKAINISYFEQITTLLGSSFDDYVYESEAGVDGQIIVEENTPKVFTKSEGAIVYIPEETKKHINTAVFINSQGNPTYEAKDLGLLDIKFKKHNNPDISLFITDHQQISHFAVVLDAAEKINKDWAEKSIHRTHGRMTFKGQKMSSRLGGVPLAKDLLDLVIEDVKEKSKDLSIDDYTAIGVSALKFTILRAMAGKNINFDPETSLSFEGDSGPYLQYSIVRANSVLNKVEGLGYNLDSKLSSNIDQTDFEKMICMFPDVVDHSIEEWAPHHIVGYLVELARMFNSWYGNTKLIDEENPNMMYNIAITKAFTQTMKNGLNLLGIKVPERM